MLREATNVVKITGVLSEMNLKKGSYTKNGKTMEMINGDFTVRVEQDCLGVAPVCDIPVKVFVNKYTNAGKENPAYANMEDAMNNLTSLAAAATTGGKADEVNLTANIRMNEYFNRSDMLVSIPQITTSFLNKNIYNNKPQANFSTEIVISKMGYVLDADGVPVVPAKYEVQGIMPLYGGRVQVVKFVVVNPDYIAAIEQYWGVNETVSVSGRLNFTTETTTEMVSKGFGEGELKSRTTHISEFVITGGDETPYDEALAFNLDEINEGLAARKVYLESLKEKKRQAPAPAPVKKSINADDLGF